MDDASGMIDTLVLATDGSASVRRAVAVGTDLADRFDATVHALYVIDEDEIAAAPEEIRDQLRVALEKKAEDAFVPVRDSTASPEVITAVRTGRPPLEITAYAEEQDADVVTIGTRGRHGEHRLLLGSVAEAVVRRCPIPVLTVRQLEAAADGSARS